MLQAVVALAVVVLLGAAWAAYRAYSVARDLNEAKDAAIAAKEAVQEGRDSDVEAEVASFRRAAHRADDRTSGPLWWTLRRLPFVGDDATTVAEVSDVAARLADRGVAPAMDSWRALSTLSLTDTSGASIDALRQARSRIATGSIIFQSSADRLAQVDTSGNMGRVQAAYDELLDQISSIGDALGAASTALEVAPSMLGDGGNRTYLVVVQNNAEIRATGGLPGLVMEAHAENGGVRFERPVPGSSIPRKQLLEPTRDEQFVYGSHVVDWFITSNATPDFPRTAEVMRAFWKDRYGRSPDGVIMLDTVTLAYLLDVLGDLTVDDVTLNGDNVVSELLNTAYRRMPIEQTDPFFAAVAQKVLERIQSPDISKSGVLSALARAGGEGRLRLFSADARDENVLAKTSLGGVLAQPADAVEPRVGVYLSESTMSKMSFYLDYDVQVSSVSCQEGRQVIEGTMTLTSSPPADIADYPPYVVGMGPDVVPGDQSPNVYLVAPQGGFIDAASVDGETGRYQADRFLDGRNIAAISVALKPTRPTTITWTMRSAVGQIGDIQVDVTPGVAKGSKSSKAPSSC